MRILLRHGISAAANDKIEPRTRPIIDQNVDANCDGELLEPAIEFRPYFIRQSRRNVQPSHWVAFLVDDRFQQLATAKTAFLTAINDFGLSAFSRTQKIVSEVRLLARHPKG